MRVVAYRALRPAGRALPHAPRAGARSIAGRASRSGAVAARCAVQRRHATSCSTLAAGYDGKDRSYLEAWGIGATGKEEALYAALAASQPERDASKWPVAYADLVWRLTPRAAVPAFAARASAAGTSCCRTQQGDDGAGIHSHAAKPPTPCSTSPSTAAATSSRTRRSGGSSTTRIRAGRGRASMPSSSGAVSMTRTRSRSTKSWCLRRRRNPRCPRWPTSPNCAATRNVAPSAAGACLMCHRIQGKGVDYAPALDGFASRQTRDVVITAIVNPSNDIAHGYEGTEITLTDGRKIHGLVLSGGNPALVQSTGGVMQMIPAALIKERKRLGTFAHAERRPVRTQCPAGGGHRRLSALIPINGDIPHFLVTFAFEACRGAPESLRSNSAALLAAHSGAPYGDWRRTQLRIASISPGVCGALT